jgi:hypothetical protein
MAENESRLEYIQRAKVSLREDLGAKSWVEKVRSIERMRSASKLAREGMAKTLAEKTKR